MDGHFVPNLSFGLPVVEAVRRSTKLPLDVHLMIAEPGRWVERFRKAVRPHDDPRRSGRRSAADTQADSPAGGGFGNLA